MSTTLYRAYDQDGTLLYVGIADDWLRRWREHRKTSAWFAEVGSVKVEGYPDRTSALLAERDAIKSERPKFNISHNSEQVAWPNKASHAWGPSWLHCSWCDRQVSGEDGWITTGTGEGRALWFCSHRECDPAVAAGVYDGSYWFYVGRLLSDGPDHWFEHLSAKRWFVAEEWWLMLERATPYPHGSRRP
jgi:hypothetical protein